MRSLIHDILTFSQINKEEIIYREVDLKEVFDDVLQDLEMTIEEKSATISIPMLPKINGDVRMMRQLISNLLSNSLKYSKPSIPPAIEVTCEQKEGMLEIAFKDNGIGFDEQYLPKIFTLFQRLHTKENYEGTGLGLAICQKIVDMHHGHLHATSQEGEGATFVVSLPTKIQQNKLQNAGL
jgi:light-regulated signal transduction histidine kinase (bacteriophytochrome)